MGTLAIGVETGQKMYDKSNEHTRLLLSQVLCDLQDEVYLYEIESLYVRYANKRACKRCEWDPDDLHGIRITDSSKHFPEAAFRAHSKPLLTGEKDVVRVEVEHEKGPVEITTRTLKMPGGEEMFLSVLRDRSERQKLEKSRMESFSEISHELRTPLTSIKGSLRLLEMGILGDLPPKAMEVVGIMSRNTNFLLSIVTDILDLQKISAGKLECEMRRLDLSAVVAESVNANRGYGQERAVSLALEDLPEEAFVQGDHRRLLQIMGNLLSNAIKNSPEDGTIRIGVTDREHRWAVSVADQGPGIPEEARAKIFDSFMQVKSANGRSLEGTGLGLSIALRLVKLHNGTIGLTSGDGIGTVFTVELPKLPEAEIARAGAIS